MTSSISLSDLHFLVISILCQRRGHTDTDAHQIADALLFAERRGNSQGVAKLLNGGMRAVTPVAAPMTHTSRSRFSALIDGAQRNGVVVLGRAVDLAAQIASEHGCALVGTHNSSTSSGALAFYARRLAAEHGLIAIVMAQSPPLVAPHGGKFARFGTNPIAIAIPTGSAGAEPLVLDFGTSAMSFYSLLARAAAREPLSDLNTAFDKHGRPTRSADDVLDGGALRTFDRGPIGSGLSLVVEVLAGLLVDAGLDVDASNSDPAAFHSNWGHFVAAFRVDLFLDAPQFNERISRLIRRLRSAGADVLMPGERGNRLAAKNAERIELSDELLNALRKELTIAKM